MAEQRLPIVNSDDGIWGDIIRQYIMKEHFNDDTDNPSNGGHQTVTIRAGTAAAGTAPLKFASGTLLSTPEPGAMEFNADSLYFTITTGTIRKRVALYNDTAGATGDLYYRDASGNFVRLGIGATGKTLRVSGGLPAWSDPDISLATTTKTSNYTVTGSDTIVFANASSGAVTITLPAASGLPGYRFYIKRTDGSGNSCSIARSGSDTIDGQTSISLATQYMSLTIASDGSGWYII